MELWEIFLIGAALSMDAVAVGMTNGMSEPGMRLPKMGLVAAVYAIFQFAMPVLGYYCSYAFAEAVKKIAPYLSFGLLAFIGGKMVFDFIAAQKRGREEVHERKLGMGKLLVQGIATAIDALAVGVTFLAEETTKGLPLHVVFCSLIIGAVTFALSLPAVALGKKIGNRFADRADLIGGIVLIAIGIKLLVEGLL